MVGATSRLRTVVVTLLHAIALIGRRLHWGQLVTRSGWRVAIRSRRRGCVGALRSWILGRAWAGGESVRRRVLDWRQRHMRHWRGRILSWLSLAVFFFFAREWRIGRFLWRRAAPITILI